MLYIGKGGIVLSVKTAFAFTNMSYGWFGLVSLLNGISSFVGYLMPKPFS